MSFKLRPFAKMKFSRKFRIYMVLCLLMHKLIYAFDICLFALNRLRHALADFRDYQG